MDIDYDTAFADIVAGYAADDDAAQLLAQHAALDAQIIALRAEAAVLRAARDARTRRQEALTGAQAQGDMLVAPSTAPLPYSTRPFVNGAAIPIVTAGHGHTLVVCGDGVRVDTVHRGHVIALLDIPHGAHVELRQPRGDDAHAPIRVGPGRYAVHRQAITNRWVSD